MRDDFCIFILSYNRAGNVPTLKTLREKVGYTGDIYFIVDHEQDKIEYEEEYGEDMVIYFDKDEVKDDIDRGDNFDEMNANIYARNHSYQIAEDLGYDYFMQLDDDYKSFRWRFNNKFVYDNQKLENVESLLESAVEFLEESGVDTVCLGQGGEYIGGEESHLAHNGVVWAKRKSMNTFICKTDRKIDWVGRINEDVNTYVRKQQIGDIHLTINWASITQEQTQQNEGGLTDVYLDQGTYVKSFYTILYAPSCVDLSRMGNTDERIHHHIKWDKAVPKILPEEHKK